MKAVPASLISENDVSQENSKLSSSFPSSLPPIPYLLPSINFGTLLSLSSSLSSSLSEHHSQHHDKSLLLSMSSSSADSASDIPPPLTFGSFGNEPQQKDEYNLPNNSMEQPNLQLVEKKEDTTQIAYSHQQSQITKDHQTNANGADSTKHDQKGALNGKKGSAEKR
jgi:hypothetical protein